jgi:hypothetical protein
MLSQLETLFLLDYAHEFRGVFDQNLVISPYNSREKLEHLLKTAQNTIDFYFPYLQDE